MVSWRENVKHLGAGYPTHARQDTSYWGGSTGTRTLGYHEDIITGDMCRYCQADGSWSPRNLPECQRKQDECCEMKSFQLLLFPAVSCPTPGNPPFGRVMYNSVTYNSLISYECNYGYMIVGETVRRCERNKVWTGLEPICRGITIPSQPIKH